MKKLSSWLLVLMMLCGMTFSAALAEDTGSSNVEKVSGYTKKNGTKVAGYTRKKPSKVADQAAPGGAPDDTVHVKGYTKKDGTKVAGYTRKKPKK